MSSPEESSDNWLPLSILWGLLVACVSAYSLRSIASPWNLVLPLISFFFQLGWSYVSYWGIDWISKQPKPIWIQRLDSELAKPFGYDIVWKGPIYFVSTLIMIGVGRMFMFFPLFFVLTVPSFFKG